jgi:hypothetical protein
MTGEVKIQISLLLTYVDNCSVTEVLLKEVHSIRLLQIPFV